MTTTATPTETPSVPSGARRFLRSRRDSVLGGVCGGLGEYFAVDATLVRIGAVVLAVVGGFSLLAYPIMWIFVPRDDGSGNPEPIAIWRILGRPDGKPPSFGRGTVIAGGTLLAIGAFAAVV
jgi:phage shock protein C